MNRLILTIVLLATSASMAPAQTPDTSRSTTTSDPDTTNAGVETEIWEFSAGSAPTVDYSALYAVLEYPLLARENRIEGDVVLRVESDAGGKADSVTVVSSPHELLSKAAIDAAEKITYTPGTQGGRPVRWITTIRVEFRLDR